MVWFQYKSGIRRKISKRYAILLQKLRAGAIVNSGTDKIRQNHPSIEPINDFDIVELDDVGETEPDFEKNNDVDFDSMDVASLKDLARSMGIDFDGRLGREKLIDLIQNAKGQ